MFPNILAMKIQFFYFVKFSFPFFFLRFACSLALGHNFLCFLSVSHPLRVKNCLGKTSSSFTLSTLYLFLCLCSSSFTVLVSLSFPLILSVCLSFSLNLSLSLSVSLSLSLLHSLSLSHSFASLRAWLFPVTLDQKRSINFQEA